ncbi:N-acetylmuramoyl-L-alanine amidase [Sporosarcina luteola]|uniref:N-acetylmuramoyl-L-alanine amidase n=1 Tax=Sporosarcina luteola TaxID=582850 RepID=UPI00203C3662|nr:N-acetylmuramoyl-L-alanine amidase [Sporosarcina luteola]MCM3743444.1 N-acetylmuramoyl-L-alanine amidase [Sporosarcina luteola]
MSKLIKWLLAIILFASIVCEMPIISAKGETIIINTKSLNVRSGPGLTYPVTGSMKQGERTEVLATSGDWHEIRFGSGTGWVASWLVVSEEAKKLSPRTAISKVSALNIRTEPSLSAAVVGQMNAGEAAVMTGRQGEWASIVLNGVDGWVHTDYITEIQQSENGQAGTAVKPEVQNPEQFTVSVDALNVRKAPGLSSKKVGLIRKGESYAIEEVDGNWVRLALGKKSSGWVYSFHGTLSAKSTAGKTEVAADNKVTVLTNGTNLRSAATTSSAIVTRANAGEKLPVSGEEGEWYKVSLPSGETAFIAKWVVSTGDLAQVEHTPEKKKKARVPGTLKGLTIVVDAGHGGNDRGTTGMQGTDEKLLTLMTAELLSAKLKAAGANVVMTRESDTYISLRKRVSVSHQHGADAFISLHYDANPDTSITGFTTYYTHSHQRSLASSINDGLASTISLRNRGTQPANFLVLRENRQNAVLIELGFLSNPSEERVLTTEMFREQASHGIYQGLLEHFDGN